MRVQTIAAVAVIGVCVGASTARADTVTFGKGALIIPMNSVFQTECGMVSAYGLIYRILEANGPGHLNENNPVTVYVVNNDGKKSPNRCVPTNKTTFQSSVGSQSNSAWNDRCDFSITTTTAGQQPVVPVDFSSPWPASNLFPNAPLMTFDDADAWPRYNPSGSGGVSTSSTTKLDAADGFTTINYSGAPFVIDAPDAPAVFKLLTNSSGDNGIIPREALQYFTCNNSNPLGETSTCVCSNIKSAGPGTTPITTFNGTSLGKVVVNVSKGVHAIQIHQATTSFTATVDKRLFSPPPTFALSEGTAPGILAEYVQLASTSRCC